MSLKDGLTGKVAVVTGGGRGIGRGIALALASEGAKVVVAELEPSRGVEVAAELAARGGEGRFEAIAQVSRGRIDYLEDWPVAKDVTMAARFVNASMDLRGEVGAIGGAAVREATAVIADFGKPELIID